MDLFYNHYLYKKVYDSDHSYNDEYINIDTLLPHVAMEWIYKDIDFEKLTNKIYHSQITTKIQELNRTKQHYKIYIDNYTHHRKIIIRQR